MYYTIKKIISTLSIIFFLFSQVFVIGHGFGSNTLIQLNNGSQQTIHTICVQALHNRISVASYNTHNNCFTSQLVKMGKKSKSNCYIRLGFDGESNDINDIICTPTQEFYRPATNEWVQAYMLKHGDRLAAKDSTTKRITYKKFVPKSIKIYMLEIENSHTFFVGKYAILTHNIFLPMAINLGFTVPFGTAASGTAGSFFGPIGLIGGFVIGGMASIIIKAIYENHIHSYKTPEYSISFIQNHCDNTTS